MLKLLAAGLVAGAILGTSLAGPASAADEEKTFEGVRYVCTGIGEDRDNPKWAAFPAKIMLTTKNGAYVANADITIDGIIVRSSAGHGVDVGGSSPTIVN